MKKQKTGRPVDQLISYITHTHVCEIKKKNRSSGHLSPPPKKEIWDRDVHDGNVMRTRCERK